jgi:hypothetical protein
VLFFSLYSDTDSECCSSSEFGILLAFFFFNWYYHLQILTLALASSTITPLYVANSKRVGKGTESSILVRYFGSFYNILDLGKCYYSVVYSK